MSDLVPRRKFDKPMISWIVVRKSRSNGEEKEEEDKLTVLNVYSKRKSLFPSSHMPPCLRPVRIRFSVQL